MEHPDFSGDTKTLSYTKKNANLTPLLYEYKKTTKYKTTIDTIGHKNLTKKEHKIQLLKVILSFQT